MNGDKRQLRSRLAVCCLLASLLTFGSVYGSDLFDPGGPISIIPGTPKFTGLTANSALHLSGTQVLTADTLLNGQVLCGSSGAAPAICTPAAGNSLAVTLSAGGISYDAIQDLRTTAGPTFKRVNTTLVTPSYAASVPVNASLGTGFRITATDGNAFTVANPTNAITGQEIVVMVRNASGGALGVLTWDTLYKIGAAWSQPGNGNSRSIRFWFDGTNWVELYRGAADVAN